MRRSRALLVLAVTLAACGDRGAETTPSASRPSAAPSLRISMDALHRQGGVPRGWKLMPAGGDARRGRQVFVDYGCPSCHAVKGETFGGAGGGAQVGPELTGMGSHHPAGYFVEAILNPNAILIDGPGYVGPDGRSVMPSYDSMTIGELTDVVAYLQSLLDADAEAHRKMGHGGAEQPMPPNPSVGPAPVPPPPAETRGAYVVMVYDALPDKIGPFQHWFRTEGAARFAAIDGVLGVETYVDTTRESGSLVTMIRFRDAAAQHAFMNGGDGGLGLEWDRFAGPHGHFVYVAPPVYRVETLSMR
jgi:hypothetical protein